MVVAIEKIHAKIEERWELLKYTVIPKIIANHVRHGEHRSHVMGSGIEFERLREYEPGDKLAHIDWRATLSQGATSEEFNPKLLTRGFIETREVPTLLLADVSRSMLFGAGVAPAHILLELLGICARLADYIGDSVGTIGFGEGIEFSMKPRKGKNNIFALLEETLLALEKAETSSGRFSTNLNIVLEEIAGPARSRSFVVVISDFLGIEPEIDWALVDIIAARHDLFAMILKNPEEDSFGDKRGYLKIRDLESGFVMRISVADYRKIIGKLNSERQEIVKNFEERGATAVVLPLDVEGSYLEILVEKFLERRIR